MYHFDSVDQRKSNLCRPRSFFFILEKKNVKKYFKLAYINLQTITVNISSDDLLGRVNKEFR